MLLTSVRPDRDILSPTPKFWSFEYHWQHYRNLFDLTDFHIYFFNSITVAGTATVLTIFVATLAAYGITRFRFGGGRNTIAAGMLFTYMFAPILIIVPFYILMRSAGLVNSKLGLVLAYTTFSLPFSMWLLRAFFQSIPLDLEEAAMTDGASRPKAVALVIVPLALPGVIAVSIFTFIVAWNDYLFAPVLINDNELKTLPIGMDDLYNATVTDWGMMMAGRGGHHHPGPRLLHPGAALPHRRLGRRRGQGIARRSPAAAAAALPRTEFTRAHSKEHHPMAAIELRNLSKNFGDVPAVRGIDLAIEDGEFIVLVGPVGVRQDDDACA